MAILFQIGREMGRATSPPVHGVAFFLFGTFAVWSSVVAAPFRAVAEDVKIRGHAKLYLSTYEVSSTTAAAAGIPRSFVDESTDFRLIAEHHAESVSSELHLQFDSLSTRFPQKDSNRDSFQPITITPAALPNDQLRFIDMTYDTDNGDQSRADDPSVTSSLHVDRSNMAVGGAGAGLKIGRQTISWGDGIVFSVLDLVAPFTPTAIDREYKAGDDGVSGRFSISQTSDVEIYQILRRDINDHEVSFGSSVLAGKFRQRLSDGEHAYSADLVVAEKYNDPLAGAGLTGDLGGFVGRVDTAVTWIDSDSAYTSLIANIDRGFIIDEMNWYGFLEYYRNGFGKDDLEEQLSFQPLTDGLRRGDIFVTENDYIAPGLRVELSARHQIQATTLLNLRDGSGIFQPQYLFLYAEQLEFTLLGTVPFGGPGTEFGGIEVDTGTGSENARPPKSVTLLVSGYF